MSSSAPTSPALRKIVEERLLQLGFDLERWCEGEVRAGRRALGEQLNQSVRRLRQATGREQIAAVLSDVARPFCNSVAAFSVSGNIVTGVTVRGLAREDAAARIGGLEFPVSEAAAFAGAIAEREPVVALSTEREIPAAVAELFGNRPGDRVHIVPIAGADEVSLLLYACGVTESAPLELLAEVAGATLAGRPTEGKPGVPGAALDLVQIQPGPPGPAREPGPQDWSTLSPAEQQAHLAAQRFARVAVAELRLYRAADVKSGRQRGDLYGALKDPIDRARDTYRQRFVGAGMVDYLHRELLRTLAHDDAGLLGPDYPGPLD